MGRRGRARPSLAAILCRICLCLCRGSFRGGVWQGWPAAPTRASASASASARGGGRTSYRRGQRPGAWAHGRLPAGPNRISRRPAPHGSPTATRWNYERRAVGPRPYPGSRFSAPPRRTKPREADWGLRGHRGPCVPAEEEAARSDRRRPSTKGRLLDARCCKQRSSEAQHQRVAQTRRTRQPAWRQPARCKPASLAEL